MTMDYFAIIAEMAKDPPDRNAPIPLSNKAETMYGATIPFHVLSWVAVFLRLYVRFRKVRDPGWDDVFVVLAALFNLASQVAMFGAVHWGLGTHLVFMPFYQIKNILHWTYVQFASYYSTAILIKISLLCQYLRLFRPGALRMLCIGLLVFVSLWGVAYAFMAWVPCFPPQAFWNKTDYAEATCYGFGYGSVSGAKAAFISFASTNAFLDTVIFMVPLAVYVKPGLQKEQILSILGLFGLGAIVVLMSFLRLWTILKNQNTAAEAIDFAWWYPLTLIMSCLEIDFAIMCASMPIFWPVLVASMSQMFVVTKEVEVRVEYEERQVIQTAKGFREEYEMSTSASLKSGGSEERLTRRSEKSWYDDSLDGEGAGSLPFSQLSPEIEAFPEVPTTPRTPRTPRTPLTPVTPGMPVEAARQGQSDLGSAADFYRWEISRA